MRTRISLRRIPTIIVVRAAMAMDEKNSRKAMREVIDRDDFVDCLIIARSDACGVISSIKFRERAEQSSGYTLRSVFKKYRCERPHHVFKSGVQRYRVISPKAAVWQIIKWPGRLKQMSW